MPLTTGPIVRLLGADWFGSGLLISGQDILTARHVVAPGGDIFAAGQAWTGHQRIVDVSFPQDDYIDLAIAHIDNDPAAAVQAVSVPEVGGSIQVGDEVQVAGYSTRELNLEQRGFYLAAFDAVANVLVLDRPAPSGFSGSPAFADSHLAGIVVARHLEQQCTFVHRLDEVIALVRANARGTVRWEEQNAHWLRRYPLGPAVNPAQIFSLAYPLILAFVSLYNSQRALMTLAQANAERLKCGPQTDTRAIVDHHYLPRPEFDCLGFWQGAFAEAGLKSPRMLAALVAVPEDDVLTREQREARSGLLLALEGWRQ